MFYFTTLCIKLWCFLLLLFIHTFVLYRGIFSKKNRLYLSALVQHWNCSRSFLTSGKKRQKLSFSYFTTGHSLPLPSTYSLPKHSQPWPRGDLCCTVFPFLILEPQCWSSCATQNWICVLSRAWIQMLNPPAHQAHAVLCGHICSVQTSAWAKRGSSIQMNCFGFPLYFGRRFGGGGKGERGGEGKWCISYWNNAGRMGVLYNVELVNCKKWQQWVTIVLWTECICEMNNNNLQWQVSVYYCLASR